MTTTIFVERWISRPNIASLESTERRVGEKDAKANLHSFPSTSRAVLCTTLMIIPRAEGWIHRKRPRHETDATHWLRFPHPSRVLCSVRRKGERNGGGMHKQNNRTRIICRNWGGRVKDHCYSKRRSSKSSLFVHLLNNSAKRRGKRERDHAAIDLHRCDSPQLKNYIWYIHVQVDLSDRQD